jgi:hypothetical protein
MEPAAAFPSASADGGAFLEFVDYAISVLASSSAGDGDESPGAGPAPPPWGWTVAQVLKSCRAYSSGVTAAILLSDLFQVCHTPCGQPAISKSGHLFVLLIRFSLLSESP